MFRTSRTRAPAQGTLLRIKREFQWSDDEGSEQWGQPEVGDVAAIAMTEPFSVLWICSMSFSSGRKTGKSVP